MKEGKIMIWSEMEYNQLENSLEDRLQFESDDDDDDDEKNDDFKIKLKEDINNIDEYE